MSRESRYPRLFLREARMQHGERMVKESRRPSGRRGEASLTLSHKECQVAIEGAIIERTQLHMDCCGIAREGAWESEKRD